MSGRPSEIIITASQNLTASAAIGGTQNNDFWRGALIFLKVTAASGTPSLAVKAQAYDFINDGWVDIPDAAFAAKTATGDADSLVIHPSVIVVANRKINNVLPRRWRLYGTLTGGSPDITISAGLCYIP